VSSAALHEAALAFLEADVRAAIEGEQPGLLAQGAVTAARVASRQRFARRDKPHAASIEIVFVRRREEAEGIGSDRVFLEFDLRCLARKKDQSEGREQTRIVSDMARALVRRYRRRADLVLSVPGATFRYADAHILHVDEDPSSGELARSVVRVVLLFSEVLA
jgi:hypothetical protein